MTTKEIANYLENKGFKYNEKNRVFVNNRYKTRCYMNRKQRDMRNYFYSNGIEWLIDNMSISDDINKNKGYFGLIRK